MTTVERMSIGWPIFLFIVFIGSYYYILKQKKILSEDHSDYKTYKFLSKWYPVIYVIFILVIMGLR